MWGSPGGGIRALWINSKAEQGVCRLLLCCHTLFWTRWLWWVWLSSRDLHAWLGCINKCIRLFKILQHIFEVMYILELLIWYRLSLTFLVSMLNPLVPGCLNNKTQTNIPPPSQDLEGPPAENIKEVLDPRYQEGRKAILHWLEGIWSWGAILGPNSGCCRPQP